MAVENIEVGGVFVERGLIGDRFDGSIPLDPTVIFAACEVPEPVAGAAEARMEVALVPPEEVAEGADPGAVQGGLCDRADAPDQADGFLAQEFGRLLLADDRKPARLVEIGGDLGEEFVVAEPDGAGDAKLVLHPFRQAGKHNRRRRVVEAGGAGEVHERLIEGERFDHRGQLFHHRADLFRDADIDVHAAPDDRGLGAEFQRLEHGHRGTDAFDPGDVAGGCDDAAPAAAHDQRFVAQ